MDLALLDATHPLLLRRVEQYSDAECASLLAVFEALGGLHGQLDVTGRALIVAAAQPLAEAARQIAFDHTRGEGPALRLATGGGVPTRPEPPTLPVLDGARAALRQASGAAAREALALLDAMESLQADLIFAAQGQEYVDARHNALCYLRAAAQMELAAEPLAALGERIAEDRCES